MTHEEQIVLVQSKFLGSPNDWQLKVFSLINDKDIPPGHLISYGNLARLANQKFGLQIGPRNTSWLRGKYMGFCVKRAAMSWLTKHISQFTVLLMKAT